MIRCWRSCPSARAARARARRSSRLRVLAPQPAGSSARLTPHEWRPTSTTGSETTKRRGSARTCRFYGVSPLGDEQSSAARASSSVPCNVHPAVARPQMRHARGSGTGASTPTPCWRRATPSAEEKGGRRGDLFEVWARAQAGQHGVVCPGEGAETRLARRVRSQRVGPRALRARTGGGDSRSSRGDVGVLDRAVGVLAYLPGRVGTSARTERLRPALPTTDRFR